MPGDRVHEPSGAGPEGACAGLASSVETLDQNVIP